MPTHVIQSYPDAPNQYTQLEIDATAGSSVPAALRFKYFAAGQLQQVSSAKLSIPFVIEFRKFDLMNGRMFWGHVEYVAAGGPRVVTPLPAERKVVLEYTANGTVKVPNRPEWLPSNVQNLDDKQSFDAITVTITIQAASRSLNHGWINFDIKHTYPRQIPLRDAAAGWEQTIQYPILDFAQSTPAPATFEPVITGPLNFSAVYTRTNSETTTNIATGVVIHVEDERAHETFASYDAATASLRHNLRNSIHLDGREFVHAPEYVLTLGDDFGFGGNRMVYRLRAFRVESAAAGAPAGWYDVADVYRSWLRTRFGPAGEPSLFFDKLPFSKDRVKNAPADQMAPHTVIANYGLDGAVDPSHPALSGWLEMHPLRNNAPDTVNAQGNATFVQLMNRLENKFPSESLPKLEVQAWGIEQAGFYQFICGYPPMTNKISKDDTKFRTGVNALANQGSVVAVTTDPLNTIFNRGRYAGHIRFKGTDWAEVHKPESWEPFIVHPFPENIRNQTCAVTMTKIAGKQFNRVWVVEHFPPIEKVPVSPHAVALKAAQKMDEWGVRRQNLPVIGSGLYRATQKQICPTAEVGRIYKEDWVRPWVIDQRVRILEFMKHGRPAYYCYRTDHQHIVAHPHFPQQTTVGYTNVIGRGSWYARRVQCMLYDAHDLGRAFDGNSFCTFRLVHEFMPPEAVAPYVDEYYSGPEMFDFVYSHLVTPKQTPGRGGWGVHPGYKEARKVAGTSLLKLDWMLSKDRDSNANRPPLRTPNISPEDVTKRKVSFREWRQKCVDHFNQHFKVEQWGTAPRGYPKGPTESTALVPWNPQNPLGTTNPPTYTYNRCVQQSFNLRANIFATGANAVRGVRIMIPSQWLEEPLDYDNEAVEHAVRASRLQMNHKDFFRFGRMLGETWIVKVNGAPPTDIWAWGDGGNLTRAFEDVEVLVKHIRLDDGELGTAWDTKPLLDFMSKPWDKESYPDGTYNEIVITPQVHHRVWQSGEGDTRKVLYAFANVSNSLTKVVFLYGRGLEGIRQAAPWRRTIHVIAPDAIAPLSGFAWAGRREPDLEIPPRSFAAVVVEK